MRSSGLLAVVLIVIVLVSVFLRTDREDTAIGDLLTPGTRDSREALERLEAAARSEDADVTTRVQLAEVAMERLRQAPRGLERIKARKAVRRAREEVEKAFLSSGGRPAMTILMARLDFAAGEDDAAIDRLRTLSWSERGLPEDARLLLARARWRRGDRAGAVHILEDLSQSAERLSTILYAADIADLRGAPELADRWLERARRKDPRSPRPGILLARRRLGSGTGEDREARRDDREFAPALEALRAGRNELARETLEDAADRDPQEPLPFLLLADLCRRTGDRAVEIDALTRAVHLRPTRPGIRLDRADAWLRAGRADAAMSDATQALALGGDPVKAGLLIARAELAGPAPNPDMVLSALDAAGDDPHLVPVRLKALAIAGRDEDAVELARRVTPLIRDRKTTLEIASELAGIGTTAARALAGNLVKGVLGDEPERGDALYLRALLSGRLEDLEQIVRSDPENHPARRELFARLVEKEPERARSLVSEAGEYGPNHPATRFLRGRVLLLDGNAPGAVEEFRAALKAKPRDSEIATWLAKAAARAGPTDEDRARENRLADIEADIRARRWADVLGKVSKWSFSDLEAGRIDRPTEAAAKILFHAGFAAEELRTPERAKDLYRSALRMRPDHVPTLNNLSLLLAAHPRTAPEALRLADRATKLAPGVAEVFDTLGTARRATEDLAGAEAAYRRAVLLFAKRGEDGAAQRSKCLLRLALTQRQSGRKPEAAKTLEAAREADPSVEKSPDWPE